MTFTKINDLDINTFSNSSTIADVDTLYQICTTENLDPIGLFDPLTILTHL